MNDEPLNMQDLTVSIPVEGGEFPSGIRFGLLGSLDADDMARRALGSISYADPLPDEPESVPPYEVPVSSFGFVGFRTGTEGAEIGLHYVSIYGGLIKLATLDVEIPDTEIQFIGTASAPSYICLRLKLSDNTYEIRDEAAEPVNDENYNWYVLHIVYIHTDGSNVYVKDRRTDWLYSSSSALDILVKVSATDDTADYLGAKLVEGYGIEIQQIGGSGETQTLEISTKPGDGKPVVPEGSGGYEKVYSFEAWRDVATTGIVMEQGDIYLGPLAFILWDDIDNVTTTPSVSSTDTHVWLEVRQDTGESTGSIGAGFAWMKYGSKADMLAALDATEQLTKCVVPLVETVWADGVITKVKNLQCGDAKIFRAAG